MHEPRTSLRQAQGRLWRLETRIKLVAIYQELHRKQPGYSARSFCQYVAVPYSTCTRSPGALATFCLGLRMP